MLRIPLNSTTKNNPKSATDSNFKTATCNDVCRQRRRQIEGMSVGKFGRSRKAVGVVGDA